MRRFMVRMYTPSAAATCPMSGVGGHIQPTPIPTHQELIQSVGGEGREEGGGLGGLGGQDAPPPSFTGTLCSCM